MAEIIDAGSGGSLDINPGLTGPTIKSEIEGINDAKENLAQQLINKFGVQGQDILDGNGNVVTPGLVDGEGTLKRLAAWSLVIDNTSLYWADQLVSNTAADDTTPQFARIGLGVTPASEYSITANSPVKISSTGTLLELVRASGTNSIYTKYDLGSATKYKFGLDNSGSFIWEKSEERSAVIGGGTLNAPARAASVPSEETNGAISEGGSAAPGVGDFSVDSGTLMSLDQQGNLTISNSIINNTVTAKLSKSTTPIITNKSSEALIPTYKAVWDAISANNDETVHEAFHQWGGKSLTGTQSPIDALLGGMASANRFASFMHPNQQFGSAYLNSNAGTVMFEYSNDGGATWQEATGRTALQNRTLFGGQDMFTTGYNISPGRPDGGSNSGYSAWTGQASSNFIKRGMRITIDLGKSNASYSGWSQYAFDLNKIILFRRLKSGTGTISVDKYAWNTSTSSHSTGKTNIIDFQLDDSIGGDAWVVLNFDEVHHFGGSGSSSNARKIVITAFGALTFNKIFAFGPSSNAALGGTYLGNYGVPYFMDGNLKMTLQGAVAVNGAVTTSSSITSAGSISTSGSISATNNVTATNNLNGKNLLLAGSSSYLRVTPTYNTTGEIAVYKTTNSSGSTSKMVYLKSDGSIYASGNISGYSVSAESASFNALDTSVLEVLGSVEFSEESTSYFYTDVELSENLYVSGNITATAFYESSDKNLKQNIFDIQNADLYKVSDIKFKEFEFKNEGIKKYGVIAQDLQEVGLNNLVKETQSESESYLTVDYISLLCLKVSQLEQEVKQLKALIGK